MPRKSAQKINLRRKKALWSSKKSLKKIKHYVFVGFLTFVSIFIIFSFVIFRNISSPFVSADGLSSEDISTKDIIIIGLYQFNDLKLDTPILDNAYVLVLDKTDKKVVQISVSPSQIVDVPGKYGEEELSKVFALGKVINESDTSGVNLLNRALENKLGVYIDRFIMFDSSTAFDFIGFFTSGAIKNIRLKDIVSLSAHGNHIKTNLNLNEFYNISTFGMTVSKSDKYNASIDTYESLILELVYDSQIALETSSVLILNGARIANLATKASKVVELSGGRVLGIDNSFEKYDQSALVVNSKDLKIVKYLADYFEISEERIFLVGEFEAEELSIIRSDVTLILGVDTVEYL